MSVSNEQINQWLQTNAGATDATIATAMNQYGVTPAQMAQATGLGQDVVQSRYDAALPMAQGIANTPGMGTQGIGVGNFVAPTPSIPSNEATYLQSKLDQLASDPVAAQQARDLGWTGGGVNELNSFLASRGLTPEQHYQQYGLKEGLKFQGAPRSQIADPAASELYKRFGVTGDVTAPTAEGILSGFKYARESGMSDDDLRKTLGEGTFNTYKTGFADYAKTGIANILADKKLSFDEAREAVKFGRDYGYDAQQLADLTGTDKKVFDAIYKNYDDTTNKVVDSVLGAEDVKTDGDKIVKALALQKKYGFTDDDLAKATDLSVDEVKGYLNPVRNFEDDYKKLLGNTSSTTAEIKKFVDDAKSNEAVSKLYGDGVSNLGAKIAELEDKWKDYKGVDPLHAERIYSQVESQREKLGGQYYQGVFGDPKVMASVLAKKGVGSLADLGEKEKFQTNTAQVQYTTADGRPVREFDDGNFGYVVESGDSGEWRMLPKDQVKATYGTYVPGSDPYDPYSFKPLSEEELATLKNGEYRQRAGTVVIDKKTGKELTDTTHELAYQSSSGGMKKKHNWLKVDFTKDGVPVMTASRAKAGLGAALQDAMPMIAMALPFVLPGLGAGLSAMLPGAGIAASGAAAAVAPTLLNQALTQGIISGGLTTLGGGQFEKGFLGGAVSPVISSGISGLLPTGMDPNIARSITGAGTGVVKGALQGGDFEDLLGQGVLSGLTNYGLGEATKGLNLTPQQLNFATGIALPMLQGQKVSPTKLMTTLASAAQQQSKGKTP